MSNPKNKGVKLFFSQYGGEQPIPPEFIAAMERTEEIQPVPNDVNPEALSGTIVESKVETNRTNERVRKTVKKKAGNITLSAIRTNDQGQPVQVTRTLFPTGSTPTQPTATTNVAIQDLGNGWSIQEVGVEGTYVANVFTPGVFAANEFSRERPNLTPEEFRPTIPTVTTRTDSAGTAVDPTLSGTELREIQTQVTEFKKRIEISTQVVPSLPVTLDKGRDTNQAKQDVTITRKLIADGTTADVATALKDVSVKQLGDGNKVQETREVAAIFDAKVYAKERPDNIPERFKAAIPAITEKHIVTGTAAAPSLSTGDIAKSEQQQNSFNKETSVTNRDVSSLPTLNGQKFDERLNVIIPYTEEVVSAGTELGEASTEVNPLGGGLELATTYDSSAIATALAAFQVVFPGKANLNLPDVLSALTLLNEEHSGDGDSTTPFFSGSWSGQGSWSVSPAATTQTSQTVMPELLPTIVPTYGNDKDTTRCIFLLPLPVTKAAVLAKVSSVLGITVSSWPAFHPRPVQAVLVGRSTALQVHAAYHVQDGGSDTGAEHSEAFVRGFSVEVGMVIKTKDIGPTIHANVTPGGAYTLSAVTLTADAYYDSETQTVPATSTSVEVTGATATTGQTTIPNSGVRLLRCDGELYGYGHAMFHTEVFDFADL